MARNDAVRKHVGVAAILLVQVGLVAGSLAKETLSPGPDLAVAATRTLSFPPGQRLGNLNLEPELGQTLEPKAVRLCAGWDYFSVAQGDVRVPRDRNVQLTIRLALSPQESARLRGQNPRKYQVFEAGRTRQDPQDLAGLSRLDPNGVYWLSIDSLTRVADADKRVLEPIRHLTGLRILTLYDTGVTDKGMEHLRSLRSLRALELAESSITSRGLAVLTDLPALEYLGFDKEVTDASLKQVAQHPSLRWLRIPMGRVWGPGLAELAKMPRLERLCLVGETGLTDQHIRHLEGLTHLKSLTLWGSACNSLTNASLASIGKLKDLEELYFIMTNPRFTAAGMAHLKGLTNLTKVDFAQTWAGPEGVGSGDALARQLVTDHPNLESILGISFLSAEGMKTLAALRNLKSLYVGLKDRHLGYSGPTGMSHLAALGSLEELLISTGSELSDADLSSLESLNHLRDLTINCSSRTTITDRGLGSIAKLHQLERLSLGHASMTRGALNQLNSLSNLQFLGVGTGGRASSGPTGDELTLDLSGLKNLKDLHLGWLPLQDSDLAFLEHLPLLKQVFIDMETDSLTGVFLRHLEKLPELNYLYISGLSGCTGEDLASLNGLPKLRSLHLTGDITNAALTSLTGPASIESINIYTNQPIQKQALADLTNSHPVIEYVRIEGLPKASTRPIPTPRRTGIGQPRK